MLKLSRIEYLKLEELIYSRARDLEIALFQYHMDNEDRLMAVHALTIYQNRDGGFGHGLEPDSLNPNSCGIQTQYALSILRELGYNHSNLDEVAEYVVYRAIHYIFHCAANEEGYIPATVPSNNDFPCAIWWKHNEETYKSEWSYNPIAYLYALGLWFTSPAHKYFKKIIKLLPKCLEHFFNCEKIEGHELRCYIELYDVLLKKNIMPEIHEKLGDKINKEIDKLISLDIDNWGKNYSGCTMPLDLLVYEHLINTEERKALIEKNLDFLLTSRGEGMWDINWIWHNEYQEFELQRIKWRGAITVKNLALLKKYNRLEEINN